MTEHRSASPMVTFAATAELERALRRAVLAYTKVKQIPDGEYNHLNMLLAAVETARQEPVVVRRSCFLHGDHTEDTCPQCVLNYGST